MCSKQEVKEVVVEQLDFRDQLRDENLNRKFADVYDSIKLLGAQIKDIPAHKTSPETKEELTSIKQNCFTRGVELKQMNDRLNEIVEKQDKQSEKLDQILENLDKKFAGKWTEKAMIAFISLLVLAALYTILESAGLKH